jgi:hypothetical protein
VEYLFAGLFGIPLYLLLKAIARRLAPPKPAIVGASVISAGLTFALGDFGVVGVVGAVCGVVDLLRTQKPVDP